MLRKHLTPPSSKSKDVALTDVVRARIERAPVRGLPMSARAMLAVFLEEADTDGEVTELSVSELADRAEMSRRQAQYVLRGLEAHGWISTKHIKRTRRMNERSIYRLLPAGRPWKPKEYPRLSSRSWAAKNSGSGCAKPGADSPDPFFPGFAGGSSRDAVVAGSCREGGTCSVPPETPTSESASTPSANHEKKDPPHDDAEGEGPPKAEEDLDQIGPAIPHVPASRQDTTLEEIRAALVNAGMSVVIGDGFESRLRALAMGRAMKLPELLRRIAIIGQKREKLIFNAAGKSTIWDADRSIQRGVIFKKITWLENDPVGEDRGRARVEPSREIQIARMVQRTIAACDRERHAHSDTMRDAVRQVKEALGASYFGVKPLEEHATEANAALVVGQYTAEGANGGRLALADAIATIKLFATFTAFKLKRNEPVLPAMTWRFLLAEIRKARPGSAAELNKKLANMTFYEKPAARAPVNRQPDTPPEMREALARSMAKAAQANTSPAPVQTSSEELAEREKLRQLEAKQNDSPEDWLLYEMARIERSARKNKLSEQDVADQRARARADYDVMVKARRRSA